MMETKRIRLYPARREQMERILADEQDQELKKRTAICWRAVSPTRRIGNGTRCG